MDYKETLDRLFDTFVVTEKDSAVDFHLEVLHHDNCLYANKAGGAMIVVPTKYPKLMEGKSLHRNGTSRTSKQVIGQYSALVSLAQNSKPVGKSLTYPMVSANQPKFVRLKGAYYPMSQIRTAFQFYPFVELMAHTIKFSPRLDALMLMEEDFLTFGIGIMLYMAPMLSEREDDMADDCVDLMSLTENGEEDDAWLL